MEASTPLLGGSSPLRRRVGRPAVFYGGALLVLAVLGYAGSYQRQQPALNMVETSSSGGAAVCVTGQVDRLELDSKLENLARPLADYFGRPVDFVFVLSEDAAVYVNDFADGLADVSGFTRISAVIAANQHESVGEVQWVEHQEPTIPYIPTDYGDLLDNALYDDRMERATSNAKMFSHYDLCAKTFAGRGVERGLKYDLLVNVREDGYFVFPVDAPVVMAALEDTDWLTQSFDANGGVNDKISMYKQSARTDDIISAPIAELMLYFNKTAFLETQNPGTRMQINSEKFLHYASVVRRGVRSATVDPPSLAVLPFRAFEDGMNCLHILEKDAICDLEGGHTCDRLEDAGFQISATEC